MWTGGYDAGSANAHETTVGTAPITLFVVDGKVRSGTGAAVQIGVYLGRRVSAEAARLGYDLLVADSVNHQVAAISMSDNAVRVVAGTGMPLRRRATTLARHAPIADTPTATACTGAGRHTAITAMCGRGTTANPTRLRF